jgi:hypothetical protein
MFSFLKLLSQTFFQMAWENKSEFILNPLGLAKDYKLKKKEEDAEYLKKLMIGEHRQKKMTAKEQAEKKEQDEKQAILDELAAMREKEREKVAKEVEAENRKDAIAEKKKDIAASYD